MDNQLFIPGKISVGFNKREDTYSGKLAYVTYYDQKGVRRKEKSWEGWRDKKMGIEDYDNVPTEGFVLNKDIGGTRHSYGWHARIEKVRTFDPRGFEMELSIPNVLFILQECTSAKGKGLEGDFVYAWSGTELLLIPVSCREYQESKKYTDGLKGKVSTKELVPGCSYRTKKQVELVYLGKFNYTQSEAWTENPSDFKLERGHVFINPAAKVTKHSYWEEKEPEFVFMSGAANLSARLTETPAENYADLLDRFNNSPHSAVCTGFSFNPFAFKYDEKNQYRYYEEETVGTAIQEVEKGKYRALKLVAVHSNDRNRSYYSYDREFLGYRLDPCKLLMVENGEIVVKDDNLPRDKTIYTRYQILGMGLKTIRAKFKGKNKELNLKVD